MSAFGLHNGIRGRRFPGEPQYVKMIRFMAKWWQAAVRLRQQTGKVVTPGRLELPAYGLGNRRSILLSYGVSPAAEMPYFSSQSQRVG